MRKNNLLLSLLALLFAVFMTACDNGSANNAKAPADSGNGGDAGGVVTPTLSFSYEYISTKEVQFTAAVENGDHNAYIYTWDYGDGEIGQNDGLTPKHTYNVTNRSYGVTLTAVPIDPENTPAIANASGIVTISETGVIIQAFRYSALSGMDYEFQAIATTTDGSSVVYTWDFGDGTIITDTPQNAMTHRYTKYNTEYTVKVSAKKANAGGNAAQPVDFPDVKIKTPGVTAQLTIEDDINTKTFKRMSVNIYDVTGALIHGYSDATGDVNTLDNVTYNWDFGDNTPVVPSSDRYVEHTYATNSAAYPVTVTITSDSFTNSINAKGTANVEVTYALTGLTATLGGRYGTELTVVASGNGGNTYAGQNTIWYTVTYPDGNKEDMQITHNDSGVGTHTFTRDLGKYLKTYNITVEAKEGSSIGRVLATKTATVQKPSFRYVLNGPNNGESYFNKSFNLSVAEGSFELKNAYYDWSFDGTNKRTTVPNISYTYAGPGNKTVNVTIGSDLLSGSEISPIELVKTFTINANVTINSLNCPNNGASTNFLRYNCRVNATGTAGTTLTYKWYKDGQAVAGCAGPYCEHTFTTYNERHTVKVDVGIQGSNSAALSKTAPITTPNAEVTISGPTEGIHGQDNTYTATTKVSLDGSSKNITLSNARYNFKLVENTNSSGEQASNTWTKAFSPDDKEYVNKVVVRTAYVEVTADNLNGKITSTNRVATSIRKPDATLQNFNQPVINCTPKNNINTIKQTCKMTLSVKTGQPVTGNFNEFTAKFVYGNKSVTATFPEGKITEGASKVSNPVDFTFDWPSAGEITTGSTPSQTYNITGNIYKTSAAGKTLAARGANISINLNMDYTLFPLVESSWYRTFGGSGYSFGTWSCGHNETTSSQVSNPKCGSGNSVSGQTLNLGHLVNTNGTLKQTLDFEWHMRINSLGTSLSDTVIKKFTVQQGQKPTDANLRFNIAKTLNDRGIKYTGSVYGQSNVFYLKISSSNANILAKPIKVWYNGTNKTGQANRLRKITPMIQNPAFSRCTMSYIQGGDGYTPRTVAFHLTEARVSFDRADKNTGIYAEVIPTGTYKPFFRFTSAAKDAYNWSSDVTNETSNTRIEKDSNNLNEWVIVDNSYGPASRIVLPKKVDVGSKGLHDGRSTMKIVFKDMLQGAGGADIIYHPTFTCEKSVGSLK